MSSRGQKTRGDPPAWGLGVGLTTPHRKKKPVTNEQNSNKPEPKRRTRENVREHPSKQVTPGGNGELELKGLMSIILT
jgi:hypothetical protein